MIQSTYIITKDIKTPFVIHTNQPHRPQIIKYKSFKAGQIVKGTIQLKDGKPDFVLVAKRLVIPINAVKEMVTKEIVSGSDGKVAIKKLEGNIKSGKPIIKYADAMIVGALLGIGSVYLAEKKQWIATPDKKNMLYGAGIGAALIAYVVYRIRNK